MHARAPDTAELTVILKSKHAVRSKHVNMQSASLIVGLSSASKRRSKTVAICYISSNTESLFGSVSGVLV